MQRPDNVRNALVSCRDKLGIGSPPAIRHVLELRIVQHANTDHEPLLDGIRNDSVHSLEVSFIRRRGVIVEPDGLPFEIGNRRDSTSGEHGTYDGETLAFDAING